MSQILQELSPIFHRQLNDRWGNPRRIAESALGEMIRRNFKMTKTDQICAGLDLGILAVQCQTREEFTTRFKSYLVQ